MSISCTCHHLFNSQFPIEQRSNQQQQHSCSSGCTAVSVPGLHLPMHAVRASRRLPAEAGREIRAAVATARAATASRTLRGAQLFLSNTSRSSSPNFRTANAGFSASAALATGGHPCPPSHLGTRHHSNGPTASLPSVRSNDGRHKRSILRKMPVQVCGLSTTLGSGRLLDTARAVAAVGGGWCGSGLAARRSMSTMSEREFHSMADEELECIHDDVEGALEDGFEDEFDCNMSVRTLTTPSTTTAVCVLAHDAYSGCHCCCCLEEWARSVLQCGPAVA